MRRIGHFAKTQGDVLVRQRPIMWETFYPCTTYRRKAFARHEKTSRNNRTGDSFGTKNGIFIGQNHPHLLMSCESYGFDYI